VRDISYYPIHRNLEDSDRSCLRLRDKTLLRAPSKTFGRLIQTLHLPISSESLAAWHTLSIGIPSRLIQISRYHTSSERLHDRCLRVLLIDIGADPEFCQQFHYPHKRNISQLSETLPTGTCMTSAEYSFHIVFHTVNCYISTYNP
jgi:phosphoenolpyruvate carboxylase